MLIVFCLLVCLIMFWGALEDSNLCLHSPGDTPSATLSSKELALFCIIDHFS